MGIGHWQPTNSQKLFHPNPQPNTSFKRRPFFHRDFSDDLVTGYLPRPTVGLASQLTAGSIIFQSDVVDLGIASLLPANHHAPPRANASRGKRAQHRQAETCQHKSKKTHEGEEKGVRCLESQLSRPLSNNEQE